MPSGRKKKGGQSYQLVTPTVKGKRVYCFGNNISHDILKEALGNSNRKERIKINPTTMPRNLLSSSILPKDLRIKSVNCDSRVSAAKRDAISEIKKYKQTILDLQREVEEKMSTMSVREPVIPSKTATILQKPLNIGENIPDDIPSNDIVTKNIVKRASESLKKNANAATDSVNTTIALAAEKANNVSDSILDTKKKAEQYTTDLINNMKETVSDIPNRAIASISNFIDKMGINKTPNLEGGRTRRKRKRRRKKTRKRIKRTKKRRYKKHKCTKKK
jgi:polyhydroxyalkanoate synthesis regulator phasin